MIKKSYNSTTLWAKRTKKREEALARNEQWAKMTPKAQLESLYRRRGASAKQIARIKKHLK